MGRNEGLPPSKDGFSQPRCQRGPVSHGFSKEWPPADFLARGPLCHGRIPPCGTWISPAWAGLRPRRAGLRFSRPSDLTKAASDFQVPWDTRVMPRKSQRVRGIGPPKSPSVARGSWEGPLRRCNPLKRYMIMLNHSLNSPTDSREEPKIILSWFSGNWSTPLLICEYDAHTYALISARLSSPQAALRAGVFYGIRGLSKDEI